MRSKANYCMTDKLWPLLPSVLPMRMRRAAKLFRHSPSWQAGLDVDSDRTETSIPDIGPSAGPPRSQEAVLIKRIKITPVAYNAQVALGGVGFVF